MVSFSCLSRGLQELWAADILQVQEFMFNFLRDPLREIDEPYFSLDEVRHLEPSVYGMGWSVASPVCCGVRALLPVSSPWAGAAVSCSAV